MTIKEMVKLTLAISIFLNKKYLWGERKYKHEYCLTKVKLVNQDSWYYQWETEFEKKKENGVNE